MIMFTLITTITVFIAIISIINILSSCLFSKTSLFLPFLMKYQCGFYIILLHLPPLVHSFTAYSFSAKSFRSGRPAVYCMPLQCLSGRTHAAWRTFTGEIWLLKEIFAFRILIYKTLCRGGREEGRRRGWEDERRMRGRERERKGGSGRDEKEREVEEGWNGERKRERLVNTPFVCTSDFSLPWLSLCMASETDTQSLGHNRIRPYVTCPWFERRPRTVAVAICLQKQLVTCKLPVCLSSSQRGYPKAGTTARLHLAAAGDTQVDRDITIFLQSIRNVKSMSCIPVLLSQHRFRVPWRKVSAS